MRFSRRLSNRRRKKIGAMVFRGFGLGVGGAGGFEGGFGGFEDLFNMFGGGFGGFQQTRRNGPRRGADIQRHMTISFEEAAFGTKKEIRLTKDVACSECEGCGAAMGT